MRLAERDKVRRPRQAQRDETHVRRMDKTMIKNSKPLALPLFGVVVLALVVVGYSMFAACPDEKAVEDPEDVNIVPVETCDGNDCDQVIVPCSKLVRQKAKTCELGVDTGLDCATSKKSVPLRVWAGVCLEINEVCQCGDEEEVPLEPGEEPQMVEIDWCVCEACPAE